MARRSSCRQGRIISRRVELAEDHKSVRAGVSGGQYKPLDEAGIAAINTAVLKILEEVGFSDAYNPSNSLLRS